ncbi:uncharacterized protein LOC108673145 [Hyalella azteca]|uniref:Uncharacterized protein LOC108673145 n=1 Tax=Hyalella azteca TaxID=294128 RepID=A0A8B7NRQ3_HYAAZ|nr:uncharacterized protein LOC108673145 [Hyalella azteca]
MCPLRSQVSLNRDKNFSFLRRSESLHDNKDSEPDRVKNLRRKNSERRRQRSSRDDVQETASHHSAATDDDALLDRLSAPPSGFAASLAATLSPLSSFVSSYSPRMPRRGSPTSTDSPNKSSDADDRETCAARAASPAKSTRRFMKSETQLNKSIKPHRTKSLTLKMSKTSAPESDCSTNNLPPEPLLIDDYTARQKELSRHTKTRGKIPKKLPPLQESQSCPQPEPDAYSVSQPLPQPHALPPAGAKATHGKTFYEKERPRVESPYGTQHEKTCQSCKCTRELHDVYHEDWVSVKERLGLADNASNRERCLQEGYSWVPPGLTSEQIYDYMSMLPGHKVPRISTPGEKYRERQLMLQLPKQDLALAYTRHVDPLHHTSYRDFVSARNDISLDIGVVKHRIPYEANCRGCSMKMPEGSVVVVAPRLGDYVAWHPACFTCNTCNELLVDLVYCVWEDGVHCGRHYAEKLKPRCAACDELIFSGEYTKAMSKDWHTEHFCCWQCDESLTGQRYVLKDDHPYCTKCYEAVFANTCDDCNQVIGIDSKDLSYKDKHWHEKCFLCQKCQVSLVDKQFGSKMEKIYCGPCYDSQFATRCDGCGEIFRAGNKKMEYKARQWHEKCFCCCVCKTAIGTRSFIPREQEIYCTGCYEEKFATRCIKCNKIITSGGVTYKNEPWHRECFTCTNCSASLAGQRFTSRDDKPYCAECFGDLFAKRCTACTKPITGIGGTRFISFEDRHWHNDCFICAMCKGSLVGKGFITDGSDILCPECAKQKLM